MEGKSPKISRDIGWLVKTIISWPDDSTQICKISCSFMLGVLRFEDKMMLAAKIFFDETTIYI